MFAVLPGSTQEILTPLTGVLGPQLQPVRHSLVGLCGALHALRGVLVPLDRTLCRDLCRMLGALYRLRGGRNAVPQLSEAVHNLG